jgi:hypothetical protein
MARASAVQPRARVPWALLVLAVLGCLGGAAADCIDDTECSSAAFCDVGVCTCNAGYVAGPEPCVDVNECLSGQPCAANSATCTNLDGTYACSCNTGYAGDGVTCAEINECTGGHNCALGALCVNVPGSFLCFCPPGHQGEGTTCSPCAQNFYKVRACIAFVICPPPRILTQIFPRVLWALDRVVRAQPARAMLAKGLPPSAARWQRAP